jgi:hypothetical protein
MVQDWAAHQFYRLLRGVVELLLVRAAHDELGRGRTPDRRILAGLPKPGSVLLAHIPARLMLKPVMRSREDCPLFIPDDLLRMLEADPQQTVEHLARVLRGMPDIPYFETRNQCESVRPIGARVARDTGYLMALGPLFFVTGRGSSMLV